MAEASQEDTTLDRKTRIDIVNHIFQLIENNSLDEIKQIFGNLQPEQCIQILNSSINGYIPLYVAVNHSNIEISRYLIEIACRQGRREMCEHWKNCRHPLTAAILHNNQRLVELILENLHDINDNINGAYTPLMMAAFLGNLESVGLIVAMGADVNRTCFQGRSPLMESTSNHEMCSFLLRHGANVLHQDDEGFSALHLAVARRHSESVLVLVNAGADVRSRNHEGLNPLIWATMNLNMREHSYMLRYTNYSILERIESLEILNVCYLFAERTTIDPWTDALRMRMKENLPKNCQIPAQEVLDFSKEFTTQKELEDLQGKPLQLAFQGILVVERILGRQNRLYMKFLLQTALIAKKENNIVKFKQLTDYIKEHCQESQVCFVAANLSSFKSLYEIGKDNDTTDYFEYTGFVIFKIIAQAVIKMWKRVKHNVYTTPVLVDNTYIELVDTFLYMISITKTENFFKKCDDQFREWITEVLKEDPRLRLYQSILHRAIKLLETTTWSSVELIDTLLQCGADANSKDSFRRTPMMYAFKNTSENVSNYVAAILVKYGAHPDVINNEGFTVMDDTNWDDSAIDPLTPLSLQCLATEVILDNNIPHEEHLPKIINDFVNLHI